MIDRVVRINDEGTWRDLFQFSSKYLFAPIRGGRRRNLTLTINSRLHCETLSPPPPQVSIRRRQKKVKPCSADPLMSLASRISAKLEEGDFKGAVRIACSDDSIADMDQATLTALQQKHPTPPADSVIPDLPPTNQSFSISEKEIALSIRSFPNSSAGGPDGLGPQHLKDLIGPLNGNGSSSLLASLSAFSIMFWRVKHLSLFVHSFLVLHWLHLKRKMEVFALLLLDVPFVVLLPNVQEVK